MLIVGLNQGRITSCGRWAHGIQAPVYLSDAELELFDLLTSRVLEFY